MDFIQVHRLSFLFEIYYPDISAQSVRDIIEKHLNRIENLNEDDVQTVMNDKVSMHWAHKDIIRNMLTLIKDKIIEVSSRKLYATQNKEMLINHQLYCHLNNSSVTRWLNTEDIKDALFNCRRREKLGEIVKANKEGKIVYEDEHGDIVIKDR